MASPLSYNLELSSLAGRARAETVVAERRRCRSSPAAAPVQNGVSPDPVISRCIRGWSPRSRGRAGVLAGRVKDGPLGEFVVIVRNPLVPGSDEPFLPAAPASLARVGDLRHPGGRLPAT